MEDAEDAFPRVCEKPSFLREVDRQNQSHADRGKRLIRSHSWSGSASVSSSQESSDSTQRDFFSAKHAEISLAAIDDDDSDQDVDATVPADEGYEAYQVLLSPRSLHESRECIPCVSSVVLKRCIWGHRCPYCHFSHLENMHRDQRPTSDMRVACKTAIRNCIETCRPNKEQMLIELQKVVNDQNAFHRNYTVKLLRDNQFIHTGDASAFEDKPAGSAKGSGKQGRGKSQQKGYRGGQARGKGLLGKISL